MRQINFSNKSNTKPRLEIQSPGGSETRRVDVERNPFTIGRAETADFQIDSAQVSREHAQLAERNGVWFIRDLGSMNGTLVNGKVVNEAILSDGDILTIAETDLTFVATTASQFQRMVTQPIQSRQQPVAVASLPAEIIAARAATEAALWQAIPVELSEVVSLTTRASAAFFASTARTDAPFQPWPSSGMRHTAADRCRELYRIRAIELAGEQDEATQLFVSVDAVEVEFPSRLLASLQRILEMTPSDLELGITISLRTILDTLKIEEICREARDHGLLVTFDEFQGSGGQVLHLDSLVPDYLLLCDSMLKDLASSRQPLRRLESVRAACEQLAIKPVLPRMTCEDTINQCQQIGYDLALRGAVAGNEMVAAAPCVAL